MPSFQTRRIGVLKSHEIPHHRRRRVYRSNLADHLLTRREDVVLIDNFFRPRLGKKHRMASLAPWPECSPFREGRPGFWRHRADFEDRDVIIHTAGQTAVTTSLANPREDFEMNAAGSLQCLEAARASGRKPIFLITSTNKVYGGLDDIETSLRGGRWIFRGLPQGVDESRPLDFHSPYGCSKGAADQYTRDYSRIYGLRSIVFRMSCQCGPRQFGTTDQGWVAHFVRAALEKREIVIYGDGKQVRDILHVRDLISAMMAAIGNIATTAGQVYNIGGGAENTISLLELLDSLEARLGYKIPRRFEPARPGDQAVYVSNIAKAQRDFGWRPQVHREQVIEDLIAWVREMLGLAAAPAA